METGTLVWMSARTILVVEDDAAVGKRIVRGLERAGFVIDWRVDGEAGLARALDSDLELIVLDLMLPGSDGFEVLERLRQEVSTPVLVLSARDGLESRLRAFELGAVDFLSKPFWMEELVVRIRRRLGLAKPNCVSWGCVEFDLDARVVWVSGVEAGLTPSEMIVLRTLARRQGRAVSRTELAEASGGGATERTIDSHVARLRKKLGDGASAIRTVRGFGYRLVLESPR